MGEMYLVVDCTHSGMLLIKVQDKKCQKMKKSTQHDRKNIILLAGPVEIPQLVFAT